MANKITTAVEFATEGAKSSLGSLRSSVADTEGAGNKFKAGFASVKDSVISHAGLLAAGAGASLVEFGIKSVEVFEHTALAARDLGAATGLTVEDASRWIGVAKDMGVSADGLSSGLGKVAKTLTDSKWADFGIQTHGAGGELRSVNDILLDTFAKLGGITNQTARAVEGNKLFGKGYANIAPLIGKTREELEHYLGSVEKGQVVTEEELKKAEAMHHAQEALKQALGEVTLALGGLVAEGAPVVDALAKIIEKAIATKDTLDKLQFKGQPIFGDLSDSVGVFGKIGDAATDMSDKFKMMVKYGPFSTTEQQKAQDMAEEIKNIDIALDGGEKSWETYGTVSSESVSETARETRNLNRATGDLTDPIELAKRAAKMMTDSIKRGLDEDKAALDNLKGNVDDHAAWTDLELEFESVKQAGTDMADAVKDHTDDAKQKTLEYSAALDGLKTKVIDYATEVLKLPVEQVTKIVAAVDPQSLDDAEALLATLTRNRDVSISIIDKGGAGYGGLSGARAEGGPVSAGGNYLVGENGPEVVHMGGNGTVIPNGAMGGQSIVVNISGVVGDKASVIRWVHEGIKQAQRQQGLSSLA